MRDKLTIVIPCKNEGCVIIDTLKWLNSHGRDYVIVVADSSDDEESLFLLRRYISIYSHILLVDGGLPSLARNLGAREVKTPYVLFLDADIQVRDRNLIEKCLESLETRDLDLVTVRFRTLDGGWSWVYRIFDFFQWVTSFSAPFALGGFMLFRTETFRALGGFNEEDRIAEDYRLSSRVSPRKFRVENLYVDTPARRFERKGLWYILRLMFACWWNRNNDEFFKRDYNYWK
jgi:glycosyltransferase involved in cell wall biosynthesis